MGERESDTWTKLELQIMQVIWWQGAGNVSAVQAGLEQQRLPQPQSSVMYRHRGRIRPPPVMEIALASPFSCDTGVLLFFYEHFIHPRLWSGMNEVHFNLSEAK
jgi:hypothetical protein